MLLIVKVKFRIFCIPFLYVSKQVLVFFLCRLVKYYKGKCKCFQKKDLSDVSNTKNFVLFSPVVSCVDPPSNFGSVSTMQKSGSATLRPASPQHRPVYSCFSLGTSFIIVKDRTPKTLLCLSI